MEQDRKRQREDDDGYGDEHVRPEFDSKRARDDPTNELISNVCKDIRRIGETANLHNQVDDMSYISNPIVVEFEKIDRLRSAVLSILHAIVVEQPQKISSLAALVIICNAKNFLVPKYVIEFFHTKLQEYVAIKSGTDNFNHIKNILKFLCSLSPIIEEGALFNLLSQFINLSIELGSDAPLGRAIHYNTLMAVPYLLSWDESQAEDVEKLVSAAGGFAHGDASDFSLYSHFNNKNNGVEVPYRPRAIVELVYPALLEAQKTGFASIRDLFINYKELVDPVVNDALQANKISNELVKHKLPQVSVNTETLSSYNPSSESLSIDSLWFKGPRLTFELYSHTTKDFPTLPEISSYAGLFFRDICTDLITNLSFNKGEASIQLSILDLYFNRSLFCPPGSSVDTLVAINNDNISRENVPPLSTWKVEDVAVESLLSLIFLTPTPPNLEIYYHSVLISCCKESPEAIAPVFGRAIRFLYSHVESLDFETRIKFMDWMTIQISNFDFSWKWDEWVSDSQALSASRFHPKKNFIRNLITKELKLSNKKKIKESFVTMDPETGDVVELDEFFKYLDLCLFDNDTKHIINYDTDIYGGDDAAKEIIAKSIYEKKETFTVTTSPQTEMFFVFGNDQLPYHHVCDKFHKFLLSNSKSKREFAEMIEELKSDITSDTINKSKFIINLVLQTYCSIGSRSIYSTISILTRDLVKLKWLTGNTLSEEDYVGNSEDYKFPELSLQNEHEQTAELQNYVVDAVFRIWIYRPQFIFLILEYLVDVKLLDFEVFVGRCFDLEHNLVVDRIDCFEALARLLAASSKAHDLARITVVTSKIIENLGQVLDKLEVSDDAIVPIDNYTAETAAKNDLQWLYYDYLDLFKWVARKYGTSTETETLVDLVKNSSLKADLTSLSAQRLQ
ncbi:Nuclear cap-binding protein subunit 1 [Yamadazyma tenuis]|uniref:MIF4G domain-containing protein n=1 Tax=Candida tenuis (strain ATCC 10573 / BCRC 21748 / CBS 615 / JCM 9827 / NBRC 10315 / NRRL Y-1498 / VKM Y-70) TaxID=590646 RepID=G3BB60_CANTC|nr:uncharacterized protein CANTEDRAFT_125733 [Yamadazyma tenuis ATCC 10573]EGV62146.1 hypothetical protein CANTEDRAFT_125733 [Yamadazyma tenuis ATCC 10573]WEJ93407.1 Nuclear cap-binding protein subunit 1 [Yamadazyma tenuis]